MLLTLLAFESRRRVRSDPCEECARGGRVEGFFRAAAGCWLPCESTEVLLRLSGV